MNREHLLKNLEVTNQTKRHVLESEYLCPE